MRITPALRTQSLHPFKPDNAMAAVCSPWQRRVTWRVEDQEQACTERRRARLSSKAYSSHLWSNTMLGTPHTSHLMSQLIMTRTLSQTGRCTDSCWDCPGSCPRLSWPWWWGPWKLRVSINTPPLPVGGSVWCQHTRCSQHIRNYFAPMSSRGCLLHFTDRGSCRHFI